MLCDGEVVQEGRIDSQDMLSVAPHGDGVLTLPLAVPQKGKATLLLHYHLTEEAARTAGSVLPEGYCLGFDEVALTTAENVNQAAKQMLLPTEPPLTAKADQALIQIREDDTSVILTGRDWRYVYDKHTGL